jgi:hypothetical protein
MEDMNKWSKGRHYTKLNQRMRNAIVQPTMLYNKGSEMPSQKLKAVYYKNNLSGYISNWRLLMNQIWRVQPTINIPQELVSLGDNTYDLSVMLSYLDAKLTILEETPLVAGEQIGYLAYAEARSFLKVCYLLARMLFDDISGVIKYFYDKNEPNSGVTKSFDDLLKKAKNEKLPKELSKLLRQTIIYFPEMRGRRVDLEHKYESLLISFRQDEEGKTILGHFSTKQHPTKEYEDIRQYFGGVLCEYQTLIDNLLDHFDAKFVDWYRFKPHRDLNILQGRSGIMLWWAYKYGNYRHKELVVTEND